MGMWWWVDGGRGLCYRNFYACSVKYALAPVVALLESVLHDGWHNGLWADICRYKLKPCHCKLKPESLCQRKCVHWESSPVRQHGRFACGRCNMIFHCKSAVCVCSVYVVCAAFGFLDKCAHRESNPRHKHGRLVCCHYTMSADWHGKTANSHYSQLARRSVLGMRRPCVISRFDNEASMIGGGGRLLKNERKFEFGA